MSDIIETENIFCNKYQALKTGASYIDEIFQPVVVLLKKIACSASSDAENTLTKPLPPTLTLWSSSLEPLKHNKIYIQTVPTHTAIGLHYTHKETNAQLLNRHHNRQNHQHTAIKLYHNNQLPPWTNLY